MFHVEHSPSLELDGLKKWVPAAATARVGAGLRPVHARPKLGTVPASGGAERRRLTEQDQAAQSPAKRVDHTSAHANLGASGNHPMFHAEHMGDSIPPPIAQ